MLKSNFPPGFVCKYQKKQLDLYHKLNHIKYVVEQSYFNRKCG
jgi:hypothetical protein